jgi:hypothetical protein
MSCVSTRRSPGRRTRSQRPSRVRRPGRTPDTESRTSSTGSRNRPTETGHRRRDTFIYIRGYSSKEERDKRLKADHDDLEVAEVALKQERDPNTKLIIKAHNIDMAPSGPHTAVKITQ